MNNTILEMKKMRRAMRPYTLLLYEMTLEMRPDYVLEIGVMKGQSTRVILSAMHENKHGLLTSIDIKSRLTNILSDDLKPYWNNVVANSSKIETLSFVDDKKYSFLLIDGDHSYEGVKRDYELYASLVEKGGFIIFHDINIEKHGVKDLWNSPEFEGLNKISLNYGMAGLGILQV